MSTRRVNEKTLRPRQYVFEGVPRERRAILRRLVGQLREREACEREERMRAAAVQARGAARAQALAVSHFKGAPVDPLNPDAGEAAPKHLTPELAALYLELEMLTTERSRLYGLLRDSASAAVAASSELPDDDDLSDSQADGDPDHDGFPAHASVHTAVVQQVGNREQSCGSPPLAARAEAPNNDAPDTTF